MTCHGEMGIAEVRALLRVVVVVMVVGLRCEKVISWTWCLTDVRHADESGCVEEGGAARLG